MLVHLNVYVPVVKFVIVVDSSLISVITGVLGAPGKTDQLPTPEVTSVAVIVTWVSLHTLLSTPAFAVVGASFIVIVTLAAVKKHSSDETCHSNT